MSSQADGNANGATEFVVELFDKVSKHWGPAPEPRFQHTVARFADFDALLFGAVDRHVEPPEIVASAIDVGRVILSGRGGGAKTVLLRQLARSASAEHAVVFIDLKSCDVINTDQWRSASSLALRINYLLACSNGTVDRPLTLRALESVASSRKRLVFVDGLNEISLQDGRLVLETLDELAAVSFNTSVIVSDRLVRRDLRDLEQWALFRMAPLSNDEVRAQLETVGLSSEIGDDQLELLKTPLFLDAALKNKQAMHSRTDAFAEYYHSHVNLSEEQIDTLSVAAYEIYSAFKSRLFPLTSLVEIVGQETVSKLQASGSLIGSSEQTHFHHHLEHDFLASKFLAKSGDLWTADVFETITFQGSSFDVLALAMEQLPTTARGDELVRKLYDWNLYGAAYALSEGVIAERASARVSDDMQLVLMAMLAMRRWDLFEITQQRASDALRLIGVPLARDLLSAETLNQVMRLVDETEGSTELFRRWKSIFNAVSLSGEISIGALLDDESLVGWTLSNRLKSLSLTEEELESLREIVNSELSPLKRWRAIHALGAFPSEATVSTLFRALDETGDEASDIRYGAIRSLVENAVLDRSDVLRKHISNELIARVDTLLLDRKTIAELQRAVQVDPRYTPKNWPALLEELLQVYFDHDLDPERRQAWQRLGARLYSHYVHA
ncbi:MAG: HEAT repeat domain-containing protein [Candidatus Eremiobacteraeota bacterium]|nr:HEAT repeat domain-containing protein [Candidatus Eremiobacteraeota bacterium]